MNTKDLLLAIDNGTQSVKALVFDSEGRLMAKEQVPLRPYVAQHPGWAEQDPEVFWQSLVQACQGLWRQGIIDKKCRRVGSLFTGGGGGRETGCNEQ